MADSVVLWASENKMSLVEISGPIIDGITGSTGVAVMRGFVGGYASILEFEELL